MHNNRAVLLRTAVLLVLLTSLGSGQNTGWSSDLEARLSVHFKLTQATADRTAIIAPGSVIVLKKDGLGLWSTQSRLVPTNTYVDGAIKPEFPSLLAGRARDGRARAFAAGEKVWLTKVMIDAKKNVVDLEFLSEEYSGSRFWGTLKFPVAKGSQPDADQFARAIDDAIAVEISPDISSNALCKALVIMTSKRPSDVVTTVLLPTASLPPKENSPNDSENHTESFLLPGDQAASVHTAVRSCLPKFVVKSAVSQNENGWLSTLHRSEPPFELGLGISSIYRQPSRKDAGYTFVTISFHRAENETQLRLDFATIAYVWTASDACGWPVSNDQKINFSRFGGVWFYQELGLAKGHIEKKGRLDFCGDSAERSKFNKLVPSLWPVGKVGAP